MEISQKLNEKKGSTVIDVAVLFFVGMLLLSVGIEYLRVQLIAYNVKDSFENAVKTVAEENYNEVYSGFREGIEAGGQFQGGPEGANQDEDMPEWVNLNDKGDVTGELEQLLGISDLNKGKGYAIRDIEIKVRNADESEYHQYEVNGRMQIIIPIHIVGFSVNAKVPVSVRNVYEKMY